MESITYKKKLENKVNAAYDKKEELIGDRANIDDECDLNRNQKYQNEHYIKLMEEAKFILRNYGYLMRESVLKTGAKSATVLVIGILIFSIIESIVTKQMGISTHLGYCAFLTAGFGISDFLKTTSHIRRCKKKNRNVNIEDELVNAYYLNESLEEEYTHLLGDREAIEHLIRETDVNISELEQELNRVKKVIAEELDPVVVDLEPKEEFPIKPIMFRKELEV